MYVCYMCSCMYQYVYLHVRASYSTCRIPPAFTRPFLYVCIYVCMHVCGCAWYATCRIPPAFTRPSLYVCIYVCMHVCGCAWYAPCRIPPAFTRPFLYVCMYVCMCTRPVEHHPLLYMYVRAPCMHMTGDVHLISDHDKRSNCSCTQRRPNHTTHLVSDHDKRSNCSCTQRRPQSHFQA
jgi:hypothetical protein